MDETGLYGRGSDRSLYGLRYHGRNYIIGDESLVSWSLRQSEESLVTHVIVPAAIDLMPNQDAFLNSFYTYCLKTR